MKLTPLDIHHKEFRRAIRGYNEEEVDVFLDQVAEEFERVFKENIDSKEQVEKMKEKVKQYEGVEETLQKALLTAQKAADEVQNNAQKESELIVKDAELKAKEIIQQILTEKQNLQSELGGLRGAEKEFREKFKDLLTQYLNVIEQDEKRENELLPQTGFEEKVTEEQSQGIEEIDETKLEQESLTERVVEESPQIQPDIDAKRAEIEAKEAEIEAKRVETFEKKEEIEAKRAELDTKEDQNASGEKDTFGQPSQPDFGAAPDLTTDDSQAEKANASADISQNEEAKPNSEGDIKITLSQPDSGTPKNDNSKDSGIAADSVSSFFDDDLGVDEEEKKSDSQVNLSDEPEDKPEAEEQDGKPQF